MRKDYRFEAEQDTANRAKAPHAVELAQQLYALARELPGPAADRVNELGWVVDAEATAGREVDEDHVRQAFALADLAISEAA